MKVMLKYEEAEDAGTHLTLRLTLPPKYVNGPTRDVVKLFVDHYNKKRGDDAKTHLDAEAFHLKVVGGDHVDRDERVRDSVSDGDECYLMSSFTAKVPAKRVPAPTAASVAAAGAGPAPASATQAKPKVTPARDDGKVRCKRLGCNKYFDPNRPPPECVHHKSPPIFHETAKWWSCCPDRKAYDWEEFMRIPGCQTSLCSAEPDGQAGQRALGGCDLRAMDSAPIRLDADAPVDPRAKISSLRSGFVAIGVDPELFDRVWNSLLQAKGGDLDAVCDELGRRFTALIGAPDFGA